MQTATSRPPAKRSQPEAEVIGLGGDPEVLRLRDAGLADVCEIGRLRTIFGTLSLYRGERPQ